MYPPCQVQCLRLSMFPFQYFDGFECSFTIVSTFLRIPSLSVCANCRYTKTDSLQTLVKETLFKKFSAIKIGITFKPCIKKICGGKKPGIAKIYFAAKPGTIEVSCRTKYGI